MGLRAARPPRVEKLKRRGDAGGLLLALQHEDVRVRGDAVAALADVDAPGVAEGLVRALADPEQDVREAAAMALERRGVQQATEPLVVAVTSWTAPKHAAARGTALAMLERLGDADLSVRAASALVERAEDLGEGDVEVMQRLTRASGAFGARTLEQLVSVLGEGARGARAGMMLVWLAPDSVEPLIEALRDDRKLMHAAFALGYIHDSRPVEPLCRLLLERPESSVRRVAAWALGEIRDLAAVEALLLASGDADYEVRIEASRSFDQFGNAGMAIALTALMPPALETGQATPAGLTEGEPETGAETAAPVEDAAPESADRDAMRPRATSPAQPTRPADSHPALPALRRLLRRRAGR